MSMMGNGGPSVLQEGASEEKGEHARLSSFVGAMAIADLVKSTLGPKGMDKILVSMGQGNHVTVTNDGATILKSIYVDNAAAKVLVDISKAQDDEVGDGTTSVVVFAGELLRQAEQLVNQKVHPMTIIQGFREACAAARANVLAATRLAALVGTVEVLHADALRMPLSTAVIDVVVADLPFGLRYAPASHAPPNLHHARRCTLRRTLPWHSPMAFARGTRPSRTHRPARSADALSSRRPLVRSALSHGRLDVGALLRELARVVRTGGRALLFGSAGNGGTAASVLNVARKHQPSA